MSILQSKIKPFFITLSFILFGLICQAQNANFVWSDISNNTKVGLQNPTFLFPKESGFTVYSIEKYGSQVYAPEIVYISKFDSKGNKLSTQEMSLPQRQRKDATLLKVVEGNDKLYFFSYVALKKDKKNVLYAQVYDNGTDEFSEINEIATIPIEKVNNSGFFEVQISEDKSKIAVLINKPFEKKAKEKIEVLILDSNLNSISQTAQTLSFDSQRAYNEELFVENDATVTIIKKTDIFKKEPITSAITIKNDELSTQTISASKFYIQDSKVLTINSNQYLLGFATNNAKPAASMGGVKDKSVFIYNLSEQKLIKNQEWSSDILKKVLGKGFINLKLKDILIDNDEIFIIGDCLSEKSELINGSNFDYNYTYNFGPGVVVKLNTNGDVFYQSYIKYGDKYKNRAKILGSFYPFLNNGKLQILINERTSSLKKKKIVAGRAVYEETIVLNTFDDSGNISTIPFWDSKTGSKNDLVYFAATNTIAVNNTTFYVYAMGGEYHRFGKLKLD